MDLRGACVREKRFKTRSVEGTLELGERIAEMLQPPLVVILRGEVGAGKTTLVKKGIGGGAGSGGGRCEVTSPTFTIVCMRVCWGGRCGCFISICTIGWRRRSRSPCLGLDEDGGV